MNGDWPQVPIGTIADIYDGPHATPKPSTEGPVFLGIGNLTEDGRLDLREMRHISEAEYPKWTRRVTPQEGDIVFTYEASLNRYAIIPPGFRGCLGRRVALIRPDLSRVDRDYLFYYLFSDEWRRTIARNLLSGATVDRIPIEKFPSFPVQLPPLPAQQQIAITLGSVDRLIRVNERRIELLEEMFRVAYLATPSEAGQGNGSSDTSLPAGWNTKLLGDMAIEKRVSVSPDDVDSTTPYVGLEHIPRRTIALTEWGAAGSVQSSKLRFEIGDILFAKIRPYLYKVAVAPVAGVCSSDTIVIAAKDSRDFGLVLRTVSSPDFVDYASQTAQGTKMPRANWKVLAKWPVVVPSADRLECLNALAEDVVAQIRNLVHTNRALGQMKLAISPSLLSGRIEIPEGKQGA